MGEALLLVFGRDVGRLIGEKIMIDESEVRDNHARTMRELMHLRTLLLRQNYRRYQGEEGYTNKEGFRPIHISPLEYRYLKQKMNGGFKSFETMYDNNLVFRYWLWGVNLFGHRPNPESSSVSGQVINFTV